MNNFKFITVALSFVLCLSAVAFGQRSTSGIEGTVVDQNGAVVSGATVSIKSTGSTAGLNQSTTADSQGYFQFAQIPVGTYQLSATGSGFKTFNQDITVSLGANTVVTAKLEVGAGQTVVDVTADAATTIDLGDTVIDTNITKRVFEDLPAGTTFASLLKIAPNVRPELGGFQIDGASGSENTFNIDGQEVTNFRTGSLNSNNNLPFELLQEVQIKSTGYEAEYGGATGGVITVATVGGNDTWHGNFGISFRPSKLQGDPRPALNRFSTAATAIPEQFLPPKDGGTAWFPVAQVSGPIIKEKLWFSAIYAPQITETHRVINYFNSSNPANRVVTETIAYDQKLHQEQMFLRIDTQPTSKLRAFGTFLYNPIIQDGVLPANTEGLSGPQSVNFGGQIGTLRGAELLGRQGGRQNSNVFNGQVTYNPTNYLVLNFRGGRSFLNEKLNSYFLPRATRFQCSTANSGIPVGAGCGPSGQQSGFQNITNNFQINYDVSTRTTFDADASLVGINAFGRHNFKFGYQLNRLFNTVDQGYADLGWVTLNYNRAINTTYTTRVTPTGSTMANPSGNCNNPNYVPGDPCNLGSGRLQRFGTIGEASSKSQSLFAQDSWQVNNRLSLNLGIRIEKETVPNFGDTSNTQAIEFNWGDKISPRIGGAFDLTGDGKTKLFASYGWFYDRFKYELPRGSFGGDFFRRDYFEILPSRGVLITGYTVPLILGNNPDPIGGTCPIPNTTGYSVCQQDFRVATNISGADIFETGAIDPDLKAARQSEWTIGVERQLWRNFLLSGRYTHKQVDRAIEDVGVFNAEGSEAYIIGNPGLGLVCEVADSSGLPCPKAERKYDAVEVRVDKRATNYFFNASYTWSRLFGNYSGLASTDELGRNSPNVNRFFDLPPLGFNANGEPDNGLLATDRTHVFKAYGGYSFDWRGNNVHRTGISAFTTIQSGTPLTTIYNLYNLGTTILFNRGDLGRTEMYTETDLSINHRYKFGRDNRFTLEGFIDIRNLFDEDNVTGVQNSISDTLFLGESAGSALVQGGCPLAIPGCETETSTFDYLFNGPGLQAHIVNYLNLAPTNRRNDYNLPNAYQAGRDVRFGFRFFF